MQVFPFSSYIAQAGHGVVLAALAVTERVLNELRISARVASFLAFRPVRRIPTEKLSLL
jgi:hypothetical protein